MIKFNETYKSKSLKKYLNEISEIIVSPRTNIEINALTTLLKIINITTSYGPTLQLLPWKFQQ